MIAYMEGLSLTEADNLKKTISKLFRQTCIVQMRYDPVTLVPRDNPDYEICVRHKDLSKIICPCLDVNWCMIRRNTFLG